VLLRWSFAKPGIRPGLVDIAARADMQAGSLYYHFASREELVAENLRLGIATAFEQAPSAVDVIDDAKPLLRLETAIRSLTMAVLQQSDYASAQAKIVGQVPPDIAKVGSRSAGLWRVMEWLVRRWCRCRGAAFGAGSVRGPHVGFWCYELEHRMVRSGSATVC